MEQQKTQLKTAQLGTTDLVITRVGFGAWALGGAGYDWGWGAQDDEDSIAAIHHALELGVNWIDTAAQYGFGHSEEVVGRALRNPAVDGAIVGFRRPEQVEPIIGAANLELADYDIAAIEGRP